MTIKLSPEAETRFNELAEELRKKLRPISQEHVARDQQSFEPTTVPAHTFTEKDIGHIPYVEYVNPLTQATQRVTYNDGNAALELATEDCDLLKELVEKLVRSSVGKKIGGRT